MIRIRLCLLTLTLCSAISGCNAFRPEVDNHYVVVRPGDPIQILDKRQQKGQKVIVTGTTLQGGNVATQDVTGWIVMPPEHWETIKPILQQYKDAKDQEAAEKAPQKWPKR